MLLGRRMLSWSASMSHLACIPSFTILYIIPNGIPSPCIAEPASQSICALRWKLPEPFCQYPNAIVLHLVLVVGSGFWHLYIVFHQFHCVCASVGHCGSSKCALQRLPSYFEPIVQFGLPMNASVSFMDTCILTESMVHMSSEHSSSSSGHCRDNTQLQLLIS